jgi:hypothetical protein
MKIKPHSLEEALLFLAHGACGWMAAGFMSTAAGCFYASGSIAPIA